MQVIKGSLQTDMFGKQHAITKYITRHIAYAHYGEVFFLNILS